MENRTANLQRAKDKKDDEFYTLYEDIDKEIKHYDKSIFKGKKVFLNCDDMRHSQFYQYFKAKFIEYDLLALDALHMKGTDGKVLHTVVTVNGTGKLVEIITDVTEMTDGDFRGYYSKEVLRKSDIIVTNPPFSLVREYVTLMREYKKEYLIIASQNAVTYKEVYPLVTSGELRVGVNSGTMNFLLPKGTEERRGTFVSGGRLYQRLGNIIWLTNLKPIKKPRELRLTKSYYDDPGQYPEYYNLEAIEVGKLTDIPYDYMGLMGVPITYINKHNPEQFEIIGHARGESFDISAPVLYKYRDNKPTGAKVGTHGDLYIPLKEGDKRPRVTYKDENGVEYKTVYSRYIIKRKG